MLRHRRTEILAGSVEMLSGRRNKDYAAEALAAQTDKLGIEPNELGCQGTLRLMDPAEFASKWKGSHLTERAAAQSHFSDMCAMLGWRTPSDLDPFGEWFAFEKRAEKLGGGDGFADVWMKDRFACEYKGKRANLRDAYRQLNDYREDLGNPPLLLVAT